MDQVVAGLLPSADRHELVHLSIDKYLLKLSLQHIMEA